MTLQEVSVLISTLKEENKTNSTSEREFNNEWIKLLLKACDNALDKAYSRKSK